MNTEHLNSALYFGRVMHRRLRPFGHRFSYRVFSLLIDLDEIPALSHKFRLFSVNSGNLFAFHERDHGPRDGSPLRPWIDDRLRHAGIDPTGGRIELLCFPRILGYVFNPLSIWFCRHRDGTLRAILYEVSNTFGERHFYLIPVAPGRDPAAPVVQSCAKRFHVSPFMEVEGTYRFRMLPPDERLSVLIRYHERNGEMMLATQTGTRRPLSDGILARAFFAYPLMTLKVIAAIHWQALLLWRRGARYHAKPQAPAHEFTTAAATE